MITKERALEVLKHLWIFDTDTDEDREALDMAMEALRNQEESEDDV